MSQFRGTPVSPGIAVGAAVLVKALHEKDHPRFIDVSQIDSEVQRYWVAVRTATVNLKAFGAELTSKIGADEAAIFEAQRMMLEDPSLTSSIEKRIRDDLMGAERAVLVACEEQALVLEAIDDACLVLLSSVLCAKLLAPHSGQNPSRVRSTCCISLLARRKVHPEVFLDRNPSRTKKSKAIIVRVT